MTEENYVSMAPPKGSLIQMFLATTPLFAVLCYFLHLAQKRPDHPRYNLTDDADDQQIRSALSDPIIGLMDMFNMFLIIAIFWSWLLAHMLLFVPKRRRLIQSYLNNNVKSILGDVSYEKYYTSRSRRFLASFFRTEYAYVTYTLEKKMCTEDDFMDKRFFESWRCGEEIQYDSGDDFGNTNDVDAHAYAYTYDEINMKN